ncbi:hypothetical protein OIV83_004218 [Microbotryomycetes sp. JL201]|nr:hypothetical protein OIV83_004218 [Microbotryomycetes sp. JL201]
MHKLPDDVKQAIERCRSVEHASDGVWQDATEIALDWILSLEPQARADATNTNLAASIKGKQAYEPPRSIVHWYCGAHGAESCWLAAVWLVRLLSFKPVDQVAQWRQKHDRLLQTCALCVESFQHAKEQLVTEFLSTLKSEKSLQAFKDGIERIEYTAVRQHFERAGLVAPSAAADQDANSSNHTGRPRLELVPVAVLHNCLVNHDLFERDNIALAVSAGLPIANAINLPRLPSSGLMAWRVCEDDRLRRWCQLQLTQCDIASEQHYTSAKLDRVLQAHLEVLANRDRGDLNAPAPINITYTSSRRAYWEGLADCLELLSPQVIEKHLKRGPNVRNDAVELVRAHLGDSGHHVLAVTTCFRHLLVKLGQAFWRDGKDGYEVVLLDAVLNNVEFENALADDAGAASTDEYLDWLDPYLDSVSSDKHLFSSSVTIIASELLERLQHLRFPVNARIKAIKIAVNVLSDICLPQATSLSSTSDLVASATRFPHAPEAIKTLDLHAGFLCRIAFGPNTDAEWNDVSRTVRSFLQQVMEQDSKRLRDAVYALGQYSSALQDLERRKKAGKKTADGAEQQPAAAIDDVPVVPPIVRISAAIWDRAYATVQDTDVRGISCLLVGAAPCAHLEQLTARTWSIRDQARAQMKAVNTGFDTIRTRLEPLIVGLADESPDSLISLMNDGAFEESIVMLLLSPLEGFQSMAQVVVKQAFDVATRRECFRCLLFQFPRETFRGLSKGIRAFLYSARILPESCGMAKRVVRCLSDVIDALCASTDGLLRDATFVMRASEGSSLSATLLSLWKSMCRALASLFKRTPTWAGFFENEQMTEWMRDAILFGVDLVDQLRTFDLSISGQTGALTGGANSSKSPQKASNVARQMLVLLNEPLEELTHWLRLNDLDLLTSSFNLLTTMLSKFNRYNVPLKETTRLKLERVARTDKPREQRSNILRDDQLMELTRALDSNKAGATVIEVSSDEDDQSNRSTQPKTSSSSSTLTMQQRMQASKGFPVASMSKTGPASAIKGPNFKVATMKNVRPRGVPWTNYSSKQNQRPSSESSSSSDEDEESDRKVSGLASLANAQKPARIKQVEKRSVKLIEVDKYGRSGRPGTLNGASKSRTEAQQAARVARLRGPADFTRLHRTVLQWDIRHDDELPPNFASKGLSIKQIGSSFKTPDDYYRAFEPLLLAECWEQIRVAKADADKEGQVLTCQIAGRQSVDDFTDVFMTIDHGQLPDKVWFNESDLVWLRQGQKSTIGKVQSSSFKREFTEVTIRCHLGSDVTDVGSRLVGRTKWEIVKLCSLSTVHREFAALQTIGDLDLFDDVAKPRPQPRITVDSRTIRQTMDTYNVNEPQAVAINNALRTRGFSLIQGPPGTGKTKTILGLVGAFVDSRPRAAAPIVPGRPTDPASVEPVAKVLLCAPSNAAVDEVAKRLKDGVRTSDGRLFVPKVVRIGADSAVDISVKDIFIDELVAREIGGDAAATNNAGHDSQSKMQSLRAEVDALRASRDAKIDEIAKVENNAALRSQLAGELKETKAKIFNLSQQLDQEKDKAQQSKRAMDAQQRKVRMQILSSADVICATLSGSGHDYMAQLPFDFETVIIDEAAQSVELSSLIPLKYGCKRCIMVGDPLQLPPTVVSSAAKKAGYERSLFVRLMDSGRGSHLLSIQYRMHPNISAFPSAAFYDSRLKDGPDMARITAQPWHDNSLFPPYAFYHVADGKEISGRHHSWSNPREAATALSLYERLLRDYPTIDFDYRLGIVTPYKGQVAELKRTFRRKFGDSITSLISFNTVDGFQGQEKDVIILSCVRGGSADSGVGFLKDTRRMNVALTRARSSLFVLGDSQKLRQNRYWSNLITDAETRGLLFTVTANTFASPSAARPPTVKTAVSKSKVKPIEVAPTFLAASEEQAKNDTRGVKRPALDSTTSSTSDVKKRVAESITFTAPSGKTSTKPNGISKPSADPAPEVKMESLEEGEIGLFAVDQKPKRPPVAAVARPKPKPSMFMPTKKRPGGKP